MNAKKLVSQWGLPLWISLIVVVIFLINPLLFSERPLVTLTPVEKPTYVSSPIPRTASIPPALNFSNSEGWLTASLPTGEMLWRLRLPNTASQSGVETKLEGGALFILDGEGRVFAVNAATGSLYWFASRQKMPASHLEVSEESVSFYVQNGTTNSVETLDRWTGTPLASTPGPRP